MGEAQCTQVALLFFHVITVMMQPLAVTAVLALGAVAGHPRRGKVGERCVDAHESVLLQTAPLRALQAAKVKAGVVGSSGCNASCTEALQGYIQRFMQEDGVQMYGEYVAVDGLEEFKHPVADHICNEWALLGIWREQSRRMGYVAKWEWFGSFAANLIGRKTATSFGAGSMEVPDMVSFSTRMRELATRRSSRR